MPDTTDILTRAAAAGFPVVDNAEHVIVQESAARMLPRAEHAIPLSVAGDVLSVLVDTIPSPAQFRDLERMAGMLVMVTVTTTEVLSQVRARVHGDTGGAPGSIGPALAEAVELGASDLHLGVGSPPVVRLNGSLVPLPAWTPLSAADLNAAATWVAGDLSSFTGDLDCAVTYQGRRWRVSVYRQRAALAMAMRLIPTNPPPAETLGLPAPVMGFADLHDGLVLFCGPTGSGKSTSMAALIDRINTTRSCHILTVEDPIEYLHPNKQAMVHQREIGADTAGFSTGLRSALRQDPDVVLVGELRDLETMTTALAAAETGHLVLATVHASSASSAVTRLVSSFPSTQQDQVRQQLAGSLQGVVYQQLLPSRVKGRVLAVETLVCTPSVRNVIREDRLHELPSLLDSSGRESGMTSFDRSLATLVSSGLLDLSTASDHVKDPAMFKQFLGTVADTQDIMAGDPLDSLPSFDTTRTTGRGTV